MDKDPLILVVDDEPQILRALKTILSSSRFRVLSATTGEQALALAAAEQPDVIILDLTFRIWTEFTCVSKSGNGRARRSLFCRCGIVNPIRWPLWIKARMIT